MTAADFFADLRLGAGSRWTDYVTHPFTTGLGDGSLPVESFRHYLAQDYLFLAQVARAYALMILKAEDVADMRAAASDVDALLNRELDLHIRLSASWGVDEAALAATEESRATLAYTRFVLDVGHSGDLLDLQTVLAPCVIGYVEIAERLAALPGATAPANPYAAWITDFSAPAYVAVAEKTRARLAATAARRLTPARRPRLQALFNQAVRLETDFWQMGLSRSL
ncbi:TenA family protein [Segnochrobactraceae bacterium EtOH-i3]